jgi:hypothetical protein
MRIACVVPKFNDRLFECAKKTTRERTGNTTIARAITQV